MYKMASMEKACVGNSSRDILENVRRTAKALLQQALLGAAQEVAEEREARGMDALISERDKLQLEKINLAAELQLRKQLLLEPLEDIEVANENHFITESEEEVKKLEEELLYLKLEYLQDNKLLECFQHQEILMKQLYPRTQDLNEPPSTVDQVVTLQTKLVSDLLQKVKELETLRNDLEENQAERALTQVHCRELMSKFTGLEYASDNGLDSHERQLNGDDEESSKLLLKRSRDEVILYRHTLLCLIGGSGVDWSKEEELCKLVVTLGQPSKWIVKPQT